MTMPPLPYQSPSPNRTDFDHIKLLVIFTYIWGGLSLLGSFFGLIYIFGGVMFMKAPATMFPTTGPSAGPPVALMGWMFIGFGIGMMVILWTLGGLNLYSARSMQLRKRRTLSLVVSGINCLSFPLGTALGVFTFIVLLRDSVAEIYRYGVGQGQDQA